MKDVYSHPKLVRRAALLAAGALLVGGCQTVKDATSTQITPRSPYGPNEQALIKDDVMPLMDGVEALPAYAHLNTEIVGGTPAVCKSIIYVPAVESSNKEVGSIVFTLGTEINGDTCPKPTASNVKRIGVELDRPNASDRQVINLDLSFRNAGDPDGVVLEYGNGGEFGAIPESDVTTALKGLSLAIGQGEQKTPEFTAQLLKDFAAVQVGN